MKKEKKLLVFFLIFIGFSILTGTVATFSQFANVYACESRDDCPTGEKCINGNCICVPGDSCWISDDDDDGSGESCPDDGIIISYFVPASLYYNWGRCDAQCHVCIGESDPRVFARKAECNDQLYMWEDGTTPVDGITKNKDVSHSCDKTGCQVIYDGEDQGSCDGVKAAGIVRPLKAGSPSLASPTLPGAESTGQNSSLPQSSPSPSPSSTAQTTSTTCDFCGWCNSSVNPKPADWDQCYACLYDANSNPSGNYYTVFGCFSTKPGNFVKSIITIFFGVSGGIAFLAVLVGSAVILTSSGNPQRLRTGKDIVTSSIIGILIIIFSVFLLKTVGMDILKIPGFG